MHRLKKKIRIARRSWGRILRLLRRYGRKKRIVPGLAIVGLILVTAGMIYQATSIKVDPAAYAPLLDTIAKGESKGNYNAYFGNVSNTTIRFTDMPVSEVLRWQEEYVRQGSVSSAVGKYQIIRPTLAGLVQKLDIDLGARFDEKLQDQMAIALLERRGSLAYVEKKLTREQFAANLAKEWAALPRVTGPNPHESHYAGDGVNKAQISIDEVYKALASLKI